MTDFDYDLFMHQANRTYLDLDYDDPQRYGQFLMNYFHQNHPDIVVPDDADCFYDNGKVAKFLHFIHSLNSNV